MCVKTSMKHLVVLASLACALASHSAVAGPAKAPLLSIQYASKRVDVYSSAAWVTTTYNADGSMASTSRGHLDRQKYNAFRAAIRQTATTGCLSSAQYVVYGTPTVLSCDSIATIETVLALR